MASVAEEMNVRSPVGSASKAPATVPALDFAAVYDEHFALVWRAARRLGVGEAQCEDAVQDTFVVLHRKLHEYDGRTPMKRWLLGIVTRVASDYRRRFRRKESACVAMPVGEEPSLHLRSDVPAPSHHLEQVEAMRLLEELLGELDDDKREVLVLTRLEELTVPEIAELLGVNVNTVYTRLRAARRDFEAAYARHSGLERRGP